jgi:hypothetical protein
VTDQDWRKRVWRASERAEALERLAARVEQNADATDLAPGCQQHAEPAIVTKAAPGRAAAAATPGNEWLRWVRREITREANRSSRAIAKGREGALSTGKRGRRRRDAARARRARRARADPGSARRA